MKNLRATAAVVGVLIIVAYSMLFGGSENSEWLTLILDVISGLAVIGIAVLMFPLFIKSDKPLSYGYLALKILEGALMIAAGVLFISGSLSDWRAWIYNYPQTYVFIFSAFLFYILLYKTRLVPRFISIWGFVACGTLLIVNAAKSLGIYSQALEMLMILIVTNEAFLAIWLMAKGFNNSALKPNSEA